MGTNRGIYGESNGHYLNWSYALYGKSNFYTASFQCGLEARAIIPTAQSSYRTYGVIGIAGNATSGWNYGVHGQLNGTNNGAGVYGTATHNEYGSYVDGRYAGYFNGETKVNGNLTVTGAVRGVLLSPAANPATPVTSGLADDNERESLSRRLATLSAIFYMEAQNRHESSPKSVGDTLTATAPVNHIQRLAANRIHYGLDAYQLREAFPELVYEQEDGTVGINYTEMIPILIQAINNLRAEIRVLKAENDTPIRQSANTTTVNLSTDGKVIGTKRVTSK